MSTNTHAIGAVTEVTGEAIVIRTDGTQETVTLGTEIFQGDIVETSGDGAVNINFIDESQFALSEDARVAMDEFVFDPATESGDQDFTVMQGVFMYTSGLIGRENPDAVEIDTPVGSIGIRGTIIGGKILPEGQGDSQITVIEGAIVVRNDAGEQLLSNQYDTVSLRSMHTPPSEVQQLSVEKVANDYGAVKNVSVNLFSSFQDQMQQEGPSDGLDSKSIAPAPEGDGADAKGGDAQQQPAAKGQGAQVIDGPQPIMAAAHAKAMAMAAARDGGDLVDLRAAKYDASKLSALFGNDAQKTYSAGPTGSNYVVYDSVAQVNTALEDKFSVTGDIDGVIPINKAGALITKLTIYDTDTNDSYSVSDFRVVGTYADKFEIANVDGDFYLKLQDNVEMKSSGPFLGFATDGVLGTESFALTDMLNLGKVILQDGDGFSSVNVQLGIGNVTYMSNGIPQTVYGTSGEIVFGTDGNDIINLKGDDFKFIKGGDGYDLINLGTVLRGQAFFLNNNDSNLTGKSADLKGIEQINLISNGNTLELNIEDIIDLLKTSANHQLKISTNSIDNALHIDENGNSIALTDTTGIAGEFTGKDINGDGHFDADDVNANGYYVFQHELGQVLIDADITISGLGSASV